MFVLRKILLLLANFTFVFAKNMPKTWFWRSYLYLAMIKPRQWAILCCFYILFLAPLPHLPSVLPFPFKVLAQYTVKKVSDFPVPSRDVTNPTLQGEYFYSVYEKFNLEQGNKCSFPFVTEPTVLKALWKHKWFLKQSFGIPQRSIIVFLSLLTKAFRLAVHDHSLCWGKNLNKCEIIRCSISFCFRKNVCIL